jgi:hypothetical protein
MSNSLESMVACDNYLAAELCKGITKRICDNIDSLLYTTDPFPYFCDPV